MGRSDDSTGYALRMTIAQLGLNQNTLARIMGRPVAMVNEVVNGKKAITAETAMQLEAAGLGEAIYWLTLQAMNDLRAERPRGLAAVRRRALTERNRRLGRPPKKSQGGA